MQKQSLELLEQVWLVSKTKQILYFIISL